MIRLHNSSHLFAVVLALWPLSGSAGEFGSAAVQDAVVGNQVASAGIWCPALEATIPQTLYAEMDCSETDTARSAVADDRVTNDPGFLGFLGPHERQGGTEDDGDGPILTVANPTPTPTPPAAEEPEGGSDPDDGSDPEGPGPEEDPKDKPKPDKKHKPKSGDKDKKSKPKGKKDKKSKPKRDKGKKSKSKGDKGKQSKGDKAKSKPKH